MQAIQTKVIPATNTRPTRIKAWCARGSLYYSTPHLKCAVNSDEAHILASNALVARFIQDDLANYGTPPANNPWSLKRVVGTLPDGSKAHVER